MEEYIVTETERSVIRKERIVRCKDCMSWNRLDSERPTLHYKFGHCEVCKMVRHEDGFCEYGKQISERQK